MRAKYWPKRSATSILQIAEVIHEPKRNLGYLGWERFDLDSVKLRDIDLAELGDIEDERRIVLVQLVQDIHLNVAEFTIADEKKVSATAGGVEKC